MSENQSNDLQHVRVKIDALDDKIHDLLMQRAELIREVSAIKRKTNKPIVHPAREAMMLRRLLGRHQGILPQSAVIGIWRELVGAVSMLQRGLHAYVSTEGDQNYCWDMAKDYCGSVIPMTRCIGSVGALSSVRDKPDAIAVLPWPIDEEAKPWWHSLVQQDQMNQPDKLPMRIIAGLPFGRSQEYTTLEHRALVVGRMHYNPSGDDNSFIAIAVQSPISRAKAIDLLKNQGFDPISIISNIDRATGSAAHFVEVKGYVDPADERLPVIEEQLEENAGRCVMLGGYPIPPVLRAGDTDPVKLD